MADELTYDCGWEYEPEYHPERGRAMLRNMYQVSARWREFADSLWAKGEATRLRWREEYEREPQMRLPLPEFCPWLREHRHPSED